MMHFGFREYDPKAGVWTAKDPIRLRGGTGLFAYSAGDPVRLRDSTGLTIGMRSPSVRLLRAVNKLRSTSRGRFLWDLLEESHTVFEIFPDRLGWTRGQPDRGQTGGDGHERGRGRKCSVDVRVDFGHQDLHNRNNQFESDVQLLAHELAHGLDYLGGLPPDPGSEELADWVADWVMGGE